MSQTFWGSVVGLAISPVSLSPKFADDNVRDLVDEVSAHPRP
jgi:hypothetical protein